MKIVTGEDNKILRARSEEIKKTEIKEYKKLGETLVKYIKDKKNGGVGLAAPQIGINKRVVAVVLLNSYDDESGKYLYLINPEIVSHGEGMDVDQEGCLSLPGYRGDVSRYTKIKLKYLDGKFNEHILNLEGLSARIVQHELDHLDGVLFTDRADKDTIEVEE